MTTESDQKRVLVVQQNAPPMRAWPFNPRMMERHGLMNIQVDVALEFASRTII